MTKYKFRDVSYGLQKLRDFLLGRKHILHGRFPPNIAPRTIPTADLPRGPDTPYSQNYYYRRNAFHSVQPPVVAPIAEGPPLIQDPTQKAKAGGVRADAVNTLHRIYIRIKKQHLKFVFFILLERDRDNLRHQFF